mmetsp:Transcript_18131/g.32291  ORF Transcript_18131/g.32291 Transcript_18131/m.32291 type:complete len:238 (+) Transcript_18131:313-1026(+)
MICEPCDLCCLTTAFFFFFLFSLLLEDLCFDSECRDLLFLDFDFFASSKALKILSTSGLVLRSVSGFGFGRPLSGTPDIRASPAELRGRVTSCAGMCTAAAVRPANRSSARDCAVISAFPKTLGETDFPGCVVACCGSSTPERPSPRFCEESSVGSARSRSSPASTSSSEEASSKIALNMSTGFPGTFVFTICTALMPCNSLSPTLASPVCPRPRLLRKTSAISAAASDARPDELGS